MQLTLTEGSAIIDVFVKHSKRKLFVIFGKYLASLKSYERSKQINKEYTDGCDMTELVKSSIYTSSELIVDALSFSLQYDNMEMLGLSLKEFDDQTLLQPFLLIDIFINKIYQKLKSGKMLPHISDKLKYLSKLCTSNNAKVDTIIYFKDVVNSIMDADKYVNTIVNNHNPIRVIVLYIDVLKDVSVLIGQIVGTFDNLFERLEKFAVHLIDECDTPGRLRNWLYDDYDGQFLVIDYLAQLKLTQVLQNEKINVIVEEMWRGNVDARQKGTSLIRAVRKSSLGFAYTSHHLNFDKFLSMLSLKYPFEYAYWWVVFAYEITTELFTQKKDVAKSLFKKKPIQHSLPFGYKTYTLGFRGQFL